MAHTLHFSPRQCLVLLQAQSMSQKMLAVPVLKPDPVKEALSIEDCTGAAARSLTQGYAAT